MGKQVSLVLELQKLASDSNVSVADLTRKALIVASKLSLHDFKKWLQLELQGYGNEPRPAYRTIRCEIKAYNPYHGWQQVIIPTENMEEALTSASMIQCVGELESLVNQSDEGQLVVPFPAGVTASLLKLMNVDIVPERFTHKTQVIGILDAVRNRILQWALKLEEEGILGEGMTFSEQEKEKAKTVESVRIEHFHGILGNVQAGNVQIGEYASIHVRLKDAGVTQEERNELENILDELERAKGEERKSVVKRGLDWIDRNKALIGNLGQLIIGWLKAGGNGGG